MIDKDQMAGILDGDIDIVITSFVVNKNGKLYSSKKLIDVYEKI